MRVCMRVCVCVTKTDKQADTDTHTDRYTTDLLVSCAACGTSFLCLLWFPADLDCSHVRCGRCHGWGIKRVCHALNLTKAQPVDNHT